MPSRRLEDRIRELCARALYETVLELQMAIQEHMLRIANLSAGAIATGKPLITERRQT
jgi:hypothetical protein